MLARVVEDLIGRHQNAMFEGERLGSDYRAPGRKISQIVKSRMIEPVHYDVHGYRTRKIKSSPQDVELLTQL